jgi:hypothetical protein
LVWVHIRTAHETEHRHLRGLTTQHAVTCLLCAFRKVDAFAVYAWRCPRFQSALRQAQLFEAGGQASSRRVSGTTRGIVV